MKWKLSETAVENAGSKLPKLAEKYFSAGRKAADQENNPEKLHGFRLKTKRFRYALELFSPIYGPSLERYIASLRGIQNALGKVSDYQTIREMVAGDKKLEAAVQRALRKEVKHFREEWKKLDSDGALHQWKACLAQVDRAAQPPSKRLRASPMLE